MTTPVSDEPRAVAYYSAAVSAWFTTSLEHDKSLLTLSAAGIGLHLTLLTTVGVRSAEALALYIGAIAGFTASLLAVLWVFRLNQGHIEDILASRVTGTDPALGRIDRFALVAFAVGVAFTAVVAISAAIHSYSEKGSIVTDEAKPGTPTYDSVNGAARIQPGSIVGNSFNGAAAIQPAASQATQQTTTAQAPAPAPASQATPTSPPASGAR